jgi:YTH domain-containing family protein
MLIYRAEMYILLRYPYLIDVNLKNENMVNDINENSQFFVIKSFSEEDVHKAIKYNVWTSTKSGNQTLSSAFKLTEEKVGHVYLFFSTNGSGRFVGVARMKSAVANDQFFPFWTQDNKWGGLFNIEWLFIKDVPFKQFKSIEITMKDGQLKPVSNSRDTQEIPFAEGKQMVQLLQSYVNSNTILEHFEYYDIRQENYERNNPQVKGALVN